MKKVVGEILRPFDQYHAYRKDAQGNIVAILDSYGEVVVEYSYDAWRRNACSGYQCETLGALNPFRYRGYYYDTETGLYFLKTRYYDPEIGRFMSIDGIEYLDSETINGLNLYAYCNNNPVMNIDPNGTWSWKKFWRGVAAVAIVVAAVAISVVTAGIATPVAAAVGGGLVGAIVGGAVAGAIGGAVVSFAFSVASQAYTNGFSNINWTQVGIETAVGAVIGGVVGGVLGAVTYLSKPAATIATQKRDVGNYLLRDSNGTVRYTGVGDKSRMAKSLAYRSKTIPNLTAEFRPAPDRITALMREAMYLNEFGGAQSMNNLTLLLNKINSPGLKYMFWWL